MKKLLQEFKERRFIDFSIDLLDDLISYAFTKAFVVSYVVFAVYSGYSFFNSYMNLNAEGCYQIRDGDTIKIVYKDINSMNIMGMIINDYVFVIRKESIYERSCLGSVSKDVYDSFKVGDTTELPLKANH